jgi:hypothetical protein
MFLWNNTFTGLHGIISQKRELLNQLYDFKEIRCFRVCCTDWFRMGCSGGYSHWRGGRFINQLSGYQHLKKDTCMRFVLFVSARTSLAPFRQLVKFCKFMSRTVSKLTSHISSPRCHLAVNDTGQNLYTKLMSQSVSFSCLKSSVVQIKTGWCEANALYLCSERHSSNPSGLLVTVTILGVLSISS